jgi:hypothetical protein
MAAVSLSAAALSKAPLELDSLGNFANLIVQERYEEAEKLLGDAVLCQMLRSDNNSQQFLEELLGNEHFLIIIELAEMLSKYGLFNKYGEIAQVIAMIWLGDPNGYFMLQELTLNPLDLSYIESIEVGYKYDSEKTDLHMFFEFLRGDIEFVQQNPFLFACLKKLQTGTLKVTDISFLLAIEGAEEELQQCIQLFPDFMKPEQMGGLCQHLLDQIKYFQEKGTLIPKKDPLESDLKT